MGVDVYQIITDKIIAELEKGVVPWRKPWVGCNFSWSRNSGKNYSLLNQILLWDSGEYATFKQISDEGGKVNKGAKASYVTFWSMLDSKKEVDEDGKPIKIPFLRYYSVFNVEKDTNLELKYHKEGNKTFNNNPIDKAETIVKNYLEHEGISHCEDSSAYYMISSDTIFTPNISKFENVEEYYSTLFHEMVHSTGAKKRLDRITKDKFGSENYSKEELVAEIGTACILNYLGIDTEKSFKNSASYIGNWLTQLKDDKRLIVSACSKAEKAVELIISCTESASEIADSEINVA